MTRPKTIVDNGRIKSSAYNGPISISMEYLDRNNYPEFCPSHCDIDFYVCFMATCKWLCSQTGAFWEHDLYKYPLEAQPIYLPIANNQKIYDFGWLADILDTEQAYELAITRRGRCHGVLNGNTFFIIWLDPDHTLCPGAGPKLPDANVCAVALTKI